ASLHAIAGEMQVGEDRISASSAAMQGKRLIDSIRAVMESSLKQEVVEQKAAEYIATADANHAIWVAVLVPVAALLTGLALTLLLLVDAIRAINATSRAATAVAGGDLQKRLKVSRRDEIGRLGDAFNRMADELAERHRRNAAIDRFQNLLVTSNSMEEIHGVVARMCTDMFPGASGAIYRIASSRNVAERIAQWNWPDAANGRVLQPIDCRALRTGQPYFVGDDTLEVPCGHIEQLGVAVARSLCLPLSAQGELFGVLLLCRFVGNVHGTATARDMETAALISEQLSMSLANMQLREQLRNQSIRDPLTGLFNRRYLEETMERELARTARNGQPLAVIAIDVDHFKSFNDTHGHEAGDKVLVGLAGVLRGGIRSTDIACRYGGEEFVLLMPESPLPIAIQRVEALRRQTSELRIKVGAIQLGPITVSSGIAIAPGHGESGEVLLRNADTALYAAKAAGRDRVNVYQAD
ncbi:MAG TPA: diguanylate cyclase, partial [Xanthomonadaceae bacterium]|nr:diguanylate cyclase [Xanthomonadaceae bacterium]